MQQITSYLIKPEVLVELFDLYEPKFRNRIVYARTVKVYKGVDNTIRLVFQNQDQKRVAIQDKSIVMYIFHPEDSSILVTVPVSISPANKGVALAVIPKEAIQFVVPGFYTYAIEVVSGEGADEVAYADDNYGAGGQIEVIDGKYPGAPRTV
jgi:hypothetical protein